MEKTSFSFDTIKDFDKHINLSIPGYSNLINHIIRISSYFIKSDSIVYDLGCSTGKLLTQLKKNHPNIKNTQFIGIDKSRNMADKSDLVINADLLDYELQKSCFTTLIFTLQFIALKDRLQVLKKIYESLEVGGCCIVSEKVYIDNGFLQDVFSFTYYDFKLENFEEKEVLKKQLDLRYIMKPVSEAQNIELFTKAGFQLIEPFWQSLQFKSWVLIK